MKSVVVYTTRICPYCMMAKRMLVQKGASYEEVRVDLDASRLSEMLNRSNGRRTVPQIFIGSEHVGGFDDLARLEHAGSLDALLKDDS